jgi:hypothetical protein
MIFQEVFLIADSKSGIGSLRRYFWNSRLPSFVSYSRVIEEPRWNGILPSAVFMPFERQLKRKSVPSSNGSLTVTLKVPLFSSIALT